MKAHIFYDDACPFCEAQVAKIKRYDKKRIFSFYPLDGERAKKELSASLRKQDTLILLENSKPWIRAKAVFRIFWLIGGWWKLIGWLYVVPGLDFFYRLVARNRHRF